MHVVFYLEWQKGKWRVHRLPKPARLIVLRTTSQAPVNFFGGSPLNRLAWLRTSEHFLSAVVRSPATQWIVFKDGQLLFANEPETKKRSLARLSTTEVRPLLGTEPFFAQGQNDGDSAESGIPVLEAARLRGPGIVFLGLHEPESGASQALPSTDFSAKTDAATVASKIEGTPYFSLDVSDLEGNAVDAVLQSTEAAKSGKSMTFVDARQAMSSMDYFDGGIVAEARAMVDWNARNKVCLTALYSVFVCATSYLYIRQYCASCGSPVYSLWAGWKLSCSTLLPWAQNEGRKPCATA